MTSTTSASTAWSICPAWDRDSSSNAIAVTARTGVDVAHDATIMMEIGALFSSGHPQGSFNDMQLGPAVLRGIPGPWPDAVAILVGAYAPLSRGTVQLNPSDLWGPPMIAPNFLSVRADLERAREGVRLAGSVTAAGRRQAERWADRWATWTSLSAARALRRWCGSVGGRRQRLPRPPCWPRTTRPERTRWRPAQCGGGPGFGGG